MVDVGEPVRRFEDPAAAATPDRLLDAAETLVADLGIDAVSVRAVNAAAGRNPAAVHYHFGSKDALVRAVLERRMSTIGTQRTAMLGALERQDRPRVRGVAEAIVRPLAHVVLREPWGPTYVRFLAALTTGERRWRALIGDAFAPQWQRLEPVLIRSVPDATRPVLLYRYEIVVGIVPRVLAELDRHAATFAGESDPRSAAVDALVDLVCAALAAPTEGAIP